MISTIVLLLAMSKYQSASARGIEPIKDSVTVTPIVTAKLIALNLIGHDIENSLYNLNIRFPFPPWEGVRG